MQIVIPEGTPSLEFSDVAYAKIMLYIQLYNEEISWLGYVVREKGNVFYVKDVYLVKQKCSSATTEMDPGGIQDLGWQLMSTGVLDVTKQETEGMYLWGHSHHTMGTSPSGQDNKQMDDFAASNPPFFIRMISNKRGEHNVELYFLKHGIKVTGMTFSIRFDLDNHPLVQPIKAEIAEKVSKFVYTAPVGAYPYPGTGRGPYRGGDYQDPHHGGRRGYDLFAGGWEDDVEFQAFHRSYYSGELPERTQGKKKKSKYKPVRQVGFKPARDLERIFLALGHNLVDAKETFASFMSRRIFEQFRPNDIHDISGRS